MVHLRGQRLGELIKKELSDLVHRFIKDPRVGFVTITNVEMSGDLQLAKIYVSALGEQEEGEKALIGLNKAKGFLRTELGKRLSVRYTPDLDFILDASLIQSKRIGDLLDNLKQGSKNHNSVDDK